MYKTIEKFVLTVEGRRIDCQLWSPPKEKLDKNPLLLVSLNGSAEETFMNEHFRQSGIPFLENGHRVASFDLPCHGNRIDMKYGEGITGFRNAFIKGVNVFDWAVEECAALIDHLIDKGLAVPGRIALCGCSRGGYMGFRAFANDKRIAAMAGIGPVTDWSCLKEFENDKEDLGITKLQLNRFEAKIAGRSVFIVIGNHDNRVCTESCLDFYLKLYETNRRTGHEKTAPSIVVTEDPGHTVSIHWRKRCGEYLLSCF